MSNTPVLEICPHCQKSMSSHLGELKSCEKICNQNELIADLSLKIQDLKKQIKDQSNPKSTRRPSQLDLSYINKTEKIDPSFLLTGPFVVQFTSAGGQLKATLVNSLEKVVELLRAPGLGDLGENYTNEDMIEFLHCKDLWYLDQDWDGEPSVWEVAIGEDAYARVIRVVDSRETRKPKIDPEDWKAIRDATYELAEATRNEGNAERAIAAIRCLYEICFEGPGDLIDLTRWMTHEPRSKPEPATRAKAYMPESPNPLDGFSDPTVSPGWAAFYASVNAGNASYPGYAPGIQAAHDQQEHNYQLGRSIPSLATYGVPSGYPVPPGYIHSSQLPLNPAPWIGFPHGYWIPENQARQWLASWQHPMAPFYGFPRQPEKKEKDS